ncbi:MAG: hypothetical protein PHQ27_03190 [Victivallales bacterium]|nr:hypothetical protein [Victivallales bacterium]
MQKLHSVKLIYLGSGLGCIGLAWLNEWVHLPDFMPKWFGEDFNLTEALTESLGIVVVIAVGWVALRRVERKMRYLEGFALLCCKCKRVRVGEHWENIETWMSSRSDITVSHGMCEDCIRKYYPDGVPGSVDTPEK